MKFREKVISADKNLKHVPRGYKRLGNFIILRSKYLLSPELGEKIQEIYQWCVGVYQHQTTSGEGREPKTIRLSGSNKTEILHKENGVVYHLDFTRITFSGGNRGLRVNMVDIINPTDILIDMFAAVGNLSLQPLYYNKNKGILIEKNEYTFGYLKKTMELNKISNIKLINDDCRNVEMKNYADRILMGYHDVDETHIAKAIDLAKNQAILHLHPLAKPQSYEECTNKYLEWIKLHDVSTELIAINKIKDYSPGLHHIEIVVAIQK